ncbi:MAG: hypothetical protein HXX81_05115 [Campylobacterales bacterium]|nr:hypothetical protein [Campylobacterales bacterium]
MQEVHLQTILDITRGFLLNDPKISKILSVSTNYADVKRGDLFIAINSSCIDEAVKRGAYAIIFDKATQISDMEIAWIKVDNIHDCMQRLLRFFLIQYSIPIFYISLIKFDILDLITNKKEVLTLNSLNIATYFKQIIEKQFKLICSNDKALLNSIYPLHQNFKQIIESVNFIKEGIFNCSYDFLNRHFLDLDISPMFVKDLNEILQFLDSNNIDYNLTNLKNLSHFSPIFITKDFKQREFGQTHTVLIFEEDIELFLEEMDFLNQKASWSKRLFFHHAFKHEGIINYSSKEHLNLLLRELNFNYALIFGNRDLIEFKQEYNNYSLF